VCLHVVAASVNELTDEIERLREADKLNQESICRYYAELAVFSLNFFDIFIDVTSINIGCDCIMQPFVYFF